MPGAGTASWRRSAGRLYDQPYLLLALASLFWAGNILLGRFIAWQVPPVTLSFVRWAGATVLLLPFAYPHLVRDWPVIRRHAGLLTVLAFTGFSAYNTMAYHGLKYTTAINGLLLQSTTPLFVALWSFALFRERLTLRQGLGISISLAGVLVIITHGRLEVLAAVGFNRGDVWFLVALAIYAYYTAVLRNRPPLHPLSFLAIGMGWGALLLVPALVFELAYEPVVINAGTVAGFAYICVFPSLLGYFFFNRGTELIGANRAAPFMHLVPVFGSVFAVALLGERFETYHAIGYALVFAGITTATRK